MDSFTHALSTFLIVVFMGSSAYAPYAIFGAVLPDIDVLFKPLSDRDPRLYIFTHGGFTHSMVGSTGVATIAFIVMFLISQTGWLEISPSIGLTEFVFLLSGTALHLLLDSLAYPGIPLAYPVSLRKLTLGIFPGPSLFLMVITVGYLILIAAGMANAEENTVYIVICLSGIGLRTGLKIHASLSTTGVTIPTIHPLRWWVIREELGAFVLSSFHLGRGIDGTRIFEKVKGVTEEEIALLQNRPEFQRHRFYSYFSTIERNGSEIIVRDPFREEGHVMYPPFFRKLTFTDMSRQ